MPEAPGAYRGAGDAGAARLAVADPPDLASDSPDAPSPAPRPQHFFYGLGLSLQVVLWFLLFLAIAVAVLVGHELTEFRYVGF